MRVPWTARRSNQSILKEVSPEYSLERCRSWSSNSLITWSEELTHSKRPWCWQRSKVRGEGDDRGWDGWMASLTRWIWVWVGDGQGGLACCSPWGCKESDMTEWLNWTEWLNILKKQTKSLAYLDFFLYYSFSAYHWRYWWYKFWKCNDSFLLTIYFEGQMTIRTSR